MSELGRRVYLTECSLCRRNMQKPTIRLSQFGWIKGWHRTLNLCQQCTRSWHEWFVGRRTELGL